MTLRGSAAAKRDRFRRGNPTPPEQCGATRRHQVPFGPDLRGGPSVAGDPLLGKLPLRAGAQMAHHQFAGCRPPQGESCGGQMGVAEAIRLHHQCPAGEAEPGRHDAHHRGAVVSVGDKVTHAEGGSGGGGVHGGVSRISRLVVKPLSGPAAGMLRRGSMSRGIRCAITPTSPSGWPCTVSSLNNEPCVCLAGVLRAARRLRRALSSRRLRSGERPRNRISLPHPGHTHPGPVSLPFFSRWSSPPVDRASRDQLSGCSDAHHLARATACCRYLFRFRANLLRNRLLRRQLSSH